jgi:hypothetical protein
MGRKNRTRRAPQAQRRTSAPKVNWTPPPPVETLVVPKGKCYENPRRKGKLKFTEQDAPKALRQAQHSRRRQGSAYREERTYLCPNCGYYHLTSRETYEERGTA